MSATTPVAFQDATIRWVKDQILDPPSRNRRVRRFLVADEVGLGKTTVARELIKSLEVKLSDLRRKQRRPIRVVYMTSNLGVAHQNAERLVPLQEQRIESDRILLAIQESMKQVARSGQIELHSWTPATSVLIHRKATSREERVFMAFLLVRMFALSRSRVAELLAQVKDVEAFKHDVSKLDTEQVQVPAALRQIVKTAWKNQAVNFKSQTYTIQELDRIQPKGLSPSEGDSLKQFIKTLRYSLIEAIIVGWEPDLIILDEFQKTPELIRYAQPIDSKSDGNDSSETSKAHAKMVRAFLNPKTPTLLLSATPYTTFSSGNTEFTQKSALLHHESLEELLTFLTDDPNEGKRLLKQIQNYGQSVLNLKDGPSKTLNQGRRNLEEALMRYWTRMERALFETLDNGPKLHRLSEYCSHQPETYALDETHIAEFFRFRRQVRQSGVLLNYWKSGRHPLTYMRNYVPFKKDLNKFKGDDLYRNVKQRNKHVKLDYLRHQILNQDSTGFQYLWIPPARPYYKGDGPFDPATLDAFSPRKALVFSHWQFVPRFVSAELGIDQEHYWRNKIGRNRYDKIIKRKVAITPTTWASLYYPSVVLSDLLTQDDFWRCTSLKDLEDLAYQRLIKVCSKVGWTVSSQKRVKKFTSWELLGSLEKALAPAAWHEMLAIYKSTHLPGPLRLRKTVESYSPISATIRRSLSGLNVSPGVIASATLRQLARIATASPAVCLRRSLAAHYPEVDWGQAIKKPPSSRGAGLLSKETPNRLIMAFSAHPLRSFVNRPNHLLAMYHGGENMRRGLEMHDAVARYFRAGNIQALFDEYVFVTKAPGEANPVAALLKNLASIFAPQRTTIRVQTSPRRGRKINTDFAVSFGGADDGGNSKDQIRQAFNSPFWPMVLSTTSIGQEGLDFHLYCRDLIHWDLPSSPVAFEQREGRINRYDNLAVRLTAQDLSLGFKLNPSQSLWPQLFANALAKADSSNRENYDLSPHWILTSSGKQNTARIRRHVLDMPFSRDVERYDRLVIDVAMYRLAMGQPNQEKFLRHLREKAHLTPRQALLLSPNLFPGARTPD